MSQSLLDRIQKQKKELKAKTGGERPTKLTAKDNTIRILPNWAGDPEGAFSHEYGQHFIKDAAGNVKAVYICSRNTSGDDCAICAARADLGVTATSNDELRILDEAKPSNRIIVNAVTKGVTSKGQSDLLELPPTVFTDILTLWERAFVDDEVNIFDLETGHDINITKEGSGRDTRYTVGIALKPSKVAAGAMSSARNLDEWVQQEYPAGEAKALTALKAGTGTAAAALAGPSAPALGHDVTDLSGVDASVLEDADVFEEGIGDIIESEAEVVETTAEETTVTEAPDDDLLADLDDLLDSEAA